MKKKKILQPTAASPDSLKEFSYLYAPSCLILTPPHPHPHEDKQSEGRGRELSEGGYWNLSQNSAVTRAL